MSRPALLHLGDTFVIKDAAGYYHVSADWWRGLGVVVMCFGRVVVRGRATNNGRTTKAGRGVQVLRQISQSETPPSE